MDTKSKHVAGKLVVTSMKMTREEHSALRQLAARENRSISGQLRHIIRTLAEAEREAA